MEGNVWFIHIMNTYICRSKTCGWTQDMETADGSRWDNDKPQYDLI